MKQRDTKKREDEEDKDNRVPRKINQIKVTENNDYPLLLTVSQPKYLKRHTINMEN